MNWNAIGTAIPSLLFMVGYTHFRFNSHVFLDLFQLHSRYRFSFLLAAVPTEPMNTHAQCHSNTSSPTDMELGHWVTGSMGHLGHLLRLGHRVIILTRCETRVFPVFDKNAENAKRTFEMLKWQKSLSGVCCWTEITGCQSMQ